MLTREWATATASHSQACVEVRHGETRLIEVRNSKAPEKGSVFFTEAEWEAFVSGTKAGEFDLPPVVG